MTDLLQDTSFWLMGSFLIFCFICYKYGKDAFLGMIDSRINQIKDELKTSENLRIEAQELLAQYQRKHRDAIKEAEGIVTAAEKQALEIRKQAEANLSETMKRKEEQLKDRIQNMEQSAIDHLRHYAATLSVSAAAQIITERLDPKISDTLIDKSIGKLKTDFH